MEITPLGDSALIVRLRDRFENAPEETLNEVVDTLQQLQDAAIPGVIELAPAYITVAVFFDPVGLVDAGARPNQIFDWLSERVRETLAGHRKRAKTRRSARVVEIPVCYDLEFALDLDDLARHTGLSMTEVVDLHSAAEYRVSCVGFTPGFPFLTGLPKELATPRRATPRKEIAAGSVGIGGAQTGVYPIGSPGGWNIIGRTPLRLFDPKRNPPALLQAGDRVRFRAITRDEFESLNH
jgi:inhibitor of KinA